MIRIHSNSYIIIAPKITISFRLLLLFSSLVKTAFIYNYDISLYICQDIFLYFMCTMTNYDRRENFNLTFL